MTVKQFISIEGIEGTGKSTIAHEVETFLRETQMAEVVSTREPGGTPMAESIRQVLLQNTQERISPVTELLLMFASRAQHVANVIQPALARGSWVISDRYVDASYAYQGYGRQISLDWIEWLDKMACADTHPGLTILIDAPVDVAMARIGRRGELDRIESEQKAFFERIRQGYLKRAKSLAHVFKVINGHQDLSEVKSQVRDVLKAYVS